MVVKSPKRGSTTALVKASCMVRNDEGQRRHAVHAASLQVVDDVLGRPGDAGTKRGLRETATSRAVRILMQQIDILSGA